MRCDKCRRKYADNWSASTSTPKYKAEEQTGLGEYAPINLCYYCSQRFQQWLTEEPEEQGTQLGEEWERT